MSAQTTCMPPTGHYGVPVIDLGALGGAGGLLGVLVLLAVACARAGRR